MIGNSASNHRDATDGTCTAIGDAEGNRGRDRRDRVGLIAICLGLAMRTDRRPALTSGGRCTSPGRACGRAGAFGAVILALLHMRSAGRPLNPLSSPISSYALTRDGWLFDLGVIGLAVGLVALVSALVRSGCLATSSPSFAVMSMCCVGLICLGDLPGPHVPRWSDGYRTDALGCRGGLALAPTLLDHGRAPGCSGPASTAPAQAPTQHAAAAAASYHARPTRRSETSSPPAGRSPVTSAPWPSTATPATAAPPSDVGTPANLLSSSSIFSTRQDVEPAHFRLG